MLYRIRTMIPGAIGRLHTLWWEHRLNVNTRGNKDASCPDGKAYQSIHYILTQRALRHVGLQPSDVFVDVGCGKGRVLFCAAQFPIRQAVGVEIDSELCAIARENIARLRRTRAPISVYNASATDFDYSAATVIAMFNPFGEKTMRATLDCIGQSLRDNPRLLRILYFNPVHENVLAEIPWLRLRERWDANPYSIYKFPVSFWESAGSSSGSGR